MKASSRLYGAVLWLFAGLFVFAAADGILNNQTIFFTYKPLVLLCGTAVLFAAGIAAARLIAKAPDIPKKWEATAVPLIMAVCFAFLLYSGFSMRVQITSDWDFGIVLGAAENYVETGERLPDYFDLFYNNAPLYVFLTAFLSLMRALGFADLTACAIVLNCAAIMLALVLMYFVLRRLLGVKAAVFGFVCALFCIGVFGYAPIVYTDTLSMPFTAGIALIWLCVREAFAAGRLKKGVLLCVLLGAAAAMGSKLKITAAIMLIAVLIDAILLLKRKTGMLFAVPALLLSFLCIYIILSAAVSSSSALYPRNKENAVPYTHWVMMGLHENGYYYDPDYKATLAAGDYDARVKFNISEIQNRIEDMGTGGMIKHFANKLSFIWGDGTFFAPMKLRQSPVEYNLLHNFLLFEFGGFGITAYFSTSALLASLLFMAAGAAIAAKNKRHEIAFLPLSLLGITFFLLMWEARSRYLVNFIPIIVICAVYGVFALAKMWYNHNIYMKKE